MFCTKPTECAFSPCKSAHIIMFVNLQVFGAKKRNAFFYFYESARIIIFCESASLW